MLRKVLPVELAAAEHGRGRVVERAAGRLDLGLPAARGGAALLADRTRRHIEYAGDVFVVDVGQAAGYALMHGAHRFGSGAGPAADVADEALCPVHCLLALHALAHGGQKSSREQHEDDAAGKGLGKDGQKVFSARPEGRKRVGDDVGRGGGPAREASEKPRGDSCNGISGRKKRRPSRGGVHGESCGSADSRAGACAAPDGNGEHERDGGRPAETEHAEDAHLRKRGHNGHGSIQERRSRLFLCGGIQRRGIGEGRYARQYHLYYVNRHISHARLSDEIREPDAGGRRRRGAGHEGSA
ncbi:MAG: hypothetical protein IKR51_06675 [Oscillospiraceae bacterium]|nr:hypothetical protein [Oscillospiraceae bacterium]